MAVRGRAVHKTHNPTVHSTWVISPKTFHKRWLSLSCLQVMVDDKSIPSFQRFSCFAIICQSLTLLKKIHVYIWKYRLAKFNTDAIFSESTLRYQQWSMLWRMALSLWYWWVTWAGQMDENKTNIQWHQSKQYWTQGLASKWLYVYNLFCKT